MRDALNTEMVRLIAQYDLEIDDQLAKAAAEVRLSPLLHINIHSSHIFSSTARSQWENIRLLNLGNGVE